MWVWLSIKLKHSRVVLSVGKHIHTCRIEMSSEFQSNAWVARQKVLNVSVSFMLIEYSIWVHHRPRDSSDCVCTSSSFAQRETSTAILPKWVRFRRMARHWSLFSQRYQFAAPFNNWNCDELHIKLIHDFIFCRIRPNSVRWYFSVLRKLRDTKVCRSNLKFKSIADFPCKKRGRESIHMLRWKWRQEFGKSSQTQWWCRQALRDIFEQRSNDTIGLSRALFCIFNFSPHISPAPQKTALSTQTLTTASTGHKS